MQGEFSHSSFTGVKLHVRQAQKSSKLLKEKKKSHIKVVHMTCALYTLQ